MKAFHNDVKIKEKYVQRVQQHKEADEIVQGRYWENGKGCAVGCTLEENNSKLNIHERMEQDLGIPRALCLLEDYLFEGLPKNKAKDFPLQFLQSIKVGSDLSKVVNLFKIEILNRNIKVQQKNKSTEKINKIVKEVIICN